MPPPPKKTPPIGEQIRAARQAAGLTQHQLAAASGVHQTVLAKYESGARDPHIQAMRDLAKALNTTFSI